MRASKIKKVILKGKVVETKTAKFQLKSEGKSHKLSPDWLIIYNVRVSIHQELTNDISTFFEAILDDDIGCLFGFYYCFSSLACLRKLNKAGIINCMTFDCNY